MSRIREVVRDIIHADTELVARTEAEKRALALLERIRPEALLIWEGLIDEHANEVWQSILRTKEEMSAARGLRRKRK